jgi:hypothetical protein
MNSARKVSLRYLNMIEKSYPARGFPIPKWIIFCKTMIDRGWNVRLYRAKTTVSKYVFVHKDNLMYKIRFSNHRANRNMEFNDDCDYYVGVGNRYTLTTEELISLLIEKDKK